MRPRALAATGLALAALASGCGGDSQGIPANQASELQRQLDSVAGRIRDGSVGACLDAIQDNPRGDNVTNVSGIIDSLPARVDQDVRDALQRSFDHLFDLVSQRCDELQQTDTTPTETTQTQTETQTETTPTETTPTETQPQTTPTTPTTTPTVPTTPDQGGQGGGSGSGGAGAPGQGP